jgi:hypothetical protein
VLISKRVSDDQQRGTLAKRLVKESKQIEIWTARPKLVACTENERRSARSPSGYAFNIVDRDKRLIGGCPHAEYRVPVD